MIKLWVDEFRFPFYIPDCEKFDDGLIRLSMIVWRPRDVQQRHEKSYHLGILNIKMSLLNQGFKI